MATGTGPGHGRRAGSRRGGAARAPVLALTLLALLAPSANGRRNEPRPGETAQGDASPLSTSLSTPLPGPIIGTNDAAGWGPAAAQTILSGHITWNRVELGSPENTLASSEHDGFHALAIAGNVEDETPLSQVEPHHWGATVAAQLKASPSVAIAEAGNESYYKGGVANPQQYGRMYMAAIEAMKAAGIHIPLLFNLTGDYPRGSWTSPSGWSEDSSGGGWLRDAVAAVPGLAAAIAANGVSIHPYGAIGENQHDDIGLATVPADESLMSAVLGSVPPIYVTEIGYDLSRCGEDLGACSKRQQATRMQEAYDQLLADPHIAGIWWYESHDDGIWRFGFMNAKNKVRPSFKTLSAIAQSVGQ